MNNLDFEMKHSLNILRRFFLCENCVMRALESGSEEDVRFWAKHYIRAAYQIQPELRVNQYMSTLKFDPTPRIVRH